MMELLSSPRRVPVTYVPISMQKQLAANHRAIGGKPYECFFLPEIEVPAAGAKLLRAGPLPREQTLTPSIADLDRLLSHASDFPDHCYALLDGPTAYAQSRVVTPGVTTRMFEWWFTWRPLEKERYMLWFPQAHVDNSVIDPARLANTSLSFAERLCNHPHGAFQPLLDRRTSRVRPIPGGRDAPALLSRMGMDTDANERLAYEMAVHDMTEFAHLGRVLPDIFAALGDT